MSDIVYLILAAADRRCAEITSLREENKRLKEVLEPFVAYFEGKRDFYSRRYKDRDLGHRNFDKMPDGWTIDGGSFNMGVYRRARYVVRGDGQ